LRLERCSKAAKDLRMLLERGYPKGSALRFVGDHHQLNTKERNILFRGVFTRDEIRRRRSKKVLVRELRERPLIIDGHNTLITLENAIQGRAFIVGEDGFVRDAERIFRRYRPSSLTRDAWTHVQKLLQQYPPPTITIILDQPLAFSGKLKAQLERWISQGGLRGQVRLSSTPESDMMALKGIHATADSVLLDRAEAVFDLAGHIILRRLRLRPLSLF